MKTISLESFARSRGTRNVLRSAAQIKHLAGLSTLTATESIFLKALKGRASKGRADVVMAATDIRGITTPALSTAAGNLFLKVNDELGRGDSGSIDTGITATGARRCEPVTGAERLFQRDMDFLNEFTSITETLNN